jgi:cytochrome d ubiquinol oxidase subunit II
MCAMHGGIFLNIKTSGDIQRRAANYSQLAALATIVIFLVAGYWIANHLQGYVLVNSMPTDAPSNPLHKKVGMEVGAWLHNYQQFPRLFLAPLFGVIGAIFAIIFVSLRFPLLAWLGSASSIAAIIITVGVSMFPFILPSSSNPSMSLMVWDASSSQLTLFTMLLASAVFLPIIILYTSWVYYVLRGKVTVADIKKRHSY